jgi:hypothetical protein
MVKGNFRKKFKKVVTLQGKNYEIVKLFEKFGQIYSFLLLKLPYLANRFAKCNRVPRVSISLFVVLQPTRFG